MGQFKLGFDNEYVPGVKTYLAFASGPPEGRQSFIRHFACKDPECDRYACTASAEWCSLFCCPGCASGEGHSGDCDRYILDMKARLVPGAPVIDSEEYGRQLRGGA